MPIRIPLISPAGSGLLALACVVAGGSARAQTPLPLPVTDAHATFTSLADEATFEIDAGTLPLRASLETFVAPDEAHPDLEYEIQVSCTWLGVFGSACDTNPYDETVARGPGADLFDAPFWTCRPVSPYPGETCDVTIRALDFGAAGAPADVDVAIRGRTRVPTSTFIQEVDAAPQPQSIDLPAFRDVTLYASDPASSNGLGEYLWAGVDYVGGFPVGEHRALQALLQFEIGAPLVPTFGRIPPGATIDDAILRLSALENRGPITSLTLAPVDDRDANPFSADTWNSGDADAPGDEFTGVASSVTGATWSHRAFPSDPWNVPGASTAVAVDTTSVPAGGFETVEFQSAALTAEVERQYISRDDGLGFEIRATSTSPLVFADQAVQMASSDHPIPALRPELQVVYTPAFPDPTVGDFPSGVVAFIGEGEDFRWVYDDDGDDVLFTAVGGRCEETEIDETAMLFVPYSYQFQGDPEFVGLDCCTWQIESMATGTVGAGQAIFFLGLDPADPANLPGDLDGDGIRDICDNCPYVPNGPRGGSCVWKDPTRASPASRTRRARRPDSAASPRRTTTSSCPGLPVPSRASGSRSPSGAW